MTEAKDEQRVAAHKREGFVRLFIAKYLLQGAAAAITNVFVPIFLYTTFNSSFYVVAVYYIAISLGYTLLLAPAMQVVNRIGFQRALVVSGAFSVLSYTMLYYLASGSVGWLLGCLLVSNIMYFVFHWVPMHVDITEFTSERSRGWSISLTLAAASLFGVVGPILSGFVITHAGYQTLFVVALLLLIASTVGYAFIPKVQEHFDWSGKETWAHFCSPNIRHFVLAEFANGAEMVVNIVIWPIFLYEILRGDVLEIGAVSTIIVAATVIIQLLLGKYLDQSGGAKGRTLKAGSVLHAIGWILKIFVLSATHVFFVGLYHNVVRIFTTTSYKTILYDLTADQGHYVDEFSALREIAQHLGRAVSLIAAMVLVSMVSIGWTFIIEAVASIAMNLVRYQQQKQL